ncbi:MAG: hypothetical protein L0387_32720 [Acidobacteria bacterium]|nr:hypothetical protein [Acidobacteriota bacterium]MCI0719133.1 hypothetical protein [Acidobacteriota bacterium]
MNRLKENTDDLAPPRVKTPWDSPTLKFVGSVKELVHGGGKSGTNRDSDPQGTFKQGIG